MDTLLRTASQSPLASWLFVLILVPSVLALKWRPDWIERGVFRPHWLLPNQEWGRLVSSAFLHADVAHLGFNLFTFWAFAFLLERRMGSALFGLLYLAGLLLSNLGTWRKHRHNPGYRTLGASGAISAVLFASVLYFPTSSLYVFPIPVALPAPVFALAYLAFTWHASRQQGGRINHDAHLGGALTGLGFVALTDPGALAAAWRTLIA